MISQLLKTSLLGSALCLALGVAPAAAQDGPPPAETLWEECAGCHGSQGEGNVDTGAPRLNGQAEWYILAQLQKFRAGLRGSNDEKDPNGNMMMGFAQGLEFDESLPMMAKFVASLPVVEPDKVVEGGKAGRGAKIFRDNCNFCHGEKAQGNQEIGAPRLAGQSDWYIVKQLNDFRAGVRGMADKDSRGQQMQAMSTILPDEEAVLDVAAFISALR